MRDWSIVQFYNGKAGLGWTYWGGVFGVSILARGIFWYINYRYLTELGDEAIARTELMQNVALIVFSLHWLLMVRALWKAGHDERTPGFWGWIGMALTSIGAVYLVFTAYTIFRPATATPLWLIQSDVREFNKMLPIEMEPGLTMIGTTMHGDVLFYDFSVRADLAEYFGTGVNHDFIHEPEGRELCTDLEGYFHGGLSEIVSRYTMEKGTWEDRITAQQCLDYLSNRDQE